MPPVGEGPILTNGPPINKPPCFHATPVTGSTEKDVKGSTDRRKREEDRQMRT